VVLSIPCTNTINKSTVGSPKGRGGSSGIIGEYILGKIPGGKINKHIHHAGKALVNDDLLERMVKDVNNADVVILSFPLYWDSMPSHLIKVLEHIHEQRKDRRGLKEQYFYTIVNNGFPEPWHNETAIAICRRFADEAGFIWRGALNVGGGGAIDGRALEELGGMTLKLRETLNMAASAVEKGMDIPPEVSERLEKPFYPRWLNFIFGGMMWRRAAKNKGVETSITARPYER